MSDAPFSAYVALRDFPGHLMNELEAAGRRVVEVHDRLVVAEGGPIEARWAQNVWRAARRIEFGSIKEAADALRAMQRNWAAHPVGNYRRLALIEERLPHVNRKRRPFPFPLPESPMGSFSLLGDHELIASPDCSSPFPDGWIEFEENKEDPPSRAYLKLWEALVRARKFPAPGERCLDAGSSPGGWTWVLAKAGCSVLSVDRSELEGRVAAMPGVEFRKGNAFALKPAALGPMDWVVSDVICYPEALYEWVMEWVGSGLARSMVCTIKMQGEPDAAAIEKFAAIPGSTVVHLCANKHELTWIRA